MSSGLYSGVSGLALGIGLYRNVSGLWGGASGLIDGFGGGDPYSGASLYLNFLAGAPLDSRITFSRGTNATLIDSTGKLTYAPNNLLLWSEEFNDANWLKLSGGTGSVPVITANAGVAPDGTSTADRLILNRGVGTTSSDLSRIFQGAALASGLGIFSVWLRSFDGVSSSAITLTNGSISSNITVTGAWQRFSLISTSTTANAQVRLQGDVGPQTADLLVWGAQLEAVTYQTTPSTYVATTASAYYGPRFDYDPVTLAPRGLLIEEARTNLLLQSDNLTTTWSTTRATVSANVTASPDGTVNADKLVDDATATQTHSVAQNLTIVAATNYTLSVYVKAAEYTSARILLGDTGGNNGVRVDVNLITGATTTGTNGTGWTLLSAAMTAVGNGWWRVTLSGTNATATAGTVVIYNTSSFGTIIYTGVVGNGVYVWGAQVEAGAFATSYIPTVAATVTRNADNAVMTGTNFSSWFNQSEGTFISAFDVISTAGISKAVFTTNDGTSNNLNLLYVSSGAVPFGEIRSGGVVQALMSSATITAVTVNAGALAYKVNDFASAVNGGAVATDTAGAVAVGQNALNIGYASNFAGLYLNGHVRAIAYFNTRLPNAQLQTLTAPSLATTLSLDFTTDSYNVGF